MDDIAVPLFALWQIAFFVWVSLSEQKWVTFAERRGAWALEQRCDLVTADEKLYNALRPAFPCIRLLEHFQAL